MNGDTPNDKDLLNARDIFRKLLDRKTREADWQRFFTNYPYVLSTSLPLRLEPQDIIPCARPGRSEPDFIFYPTKVNPIPFYGVIEIKRPDSKILTVTRSNTVVLTRDAQTAMEQAHVYSMNLSIRSLISAENIICLGNQSYIFIIMGMSKELSLKLGNSILQELVRERLPRNVQFLPYDYILRQFEATLPPKVYILVPYTKTGKDTITLRELYNSGLSNQRSVYALRRRMREGILHKSLRYVSGRTYFVDRRLSVVMLKAASMCKASGVNWESIGHALIKKDIVTFIRDQSDRGLSDDVIAELVYHQIMQEFIK